MTDIVLAARDLDPNLSRAWVAMGHSQGGQGALFTSRFADVYSAGLELRGVVALAPPSQLATVLGMLGEGPATPPEQEAAAGGSGSTASFLGPLLVAAAQTADVPVGQVVSSAGRARVPHLEQRCIAGLLATDSFGGLPAREFIADDADLTRIRRTVDTHDASTLSPKVPVLLVQGQEDTTVRPLLNDRLSKQFEQRGRTWNTSGCPTRTTSRC